MLVFFGSFGIFSYFICALCQNTDEHNAEVFAVINVAALPERLTTDLILWTFVYVIAKTVSR